MMTTSIAKTFGIVKEVRIGRTTRRPDFVIKQHSRLITLLDAKYRDLWSKPLPSSMRYQLAIYALSQSLPSTNAIFFPTNLSSAKESRIEILKPSDGGNRMGEVHLRPVNLVNLELILRFDDNSSRKNRAKAAESLAFGGNGPWKRSE